MGIRKRSIDRTRTRGSTLLEVLFAMTLLSFIFMVWCSAAIQAYQGENVAAENTLAVTTANYVVEEVRRDPNFWSEPDGTAWTSNGQLNPCGLGQLPIYADAGPATGTWHDGLNCANPTAGNYYQYQWRADPKPGLVGQAALITIWVKTGIAGRTEIYKMVTEAKKP